MKWSNIFYKYLPTSYSRNEDRRRKKSPKLGFLSFLLEFSWLWQPPLGQKNSKYCKVIRKICFTTYSYFRFHCIFLKCYEKNIDDCQIYKKTNQFWKIYLRVDVIPGSLLLFFFKAFFFHFTSNSLFDFCCVILRFPLICFLLQLRCSSFHSPSLSWKKQPYI